MAATAPLHADTGGIQGAAAQLAAAAHALSAVAADPAIHPPLAADETSGSVAARLSGHGAIVASRARDAVAVLHSAAGAIAQAAAAYASMDSANQAVVSLRGNPSTPTPTPTPAITADIPVPEIPMLPPAPRPGAVTAAIVEAGQPDAGASFLAACQAASAEFRSCGTTARAAAATIDTHLQGQAGPHIAAALLRFADWTHTMAGHTDAIGQWANDHKNRFARTQHATPKTVEFSNTQRELRAATAQFASHPGPHTAAAVTRAQAALSSLNQRTTAVAAGYHFGELPTAPPGPPPVVPVVGPSGPQAGSPNSPARPAPGQPGPTAPGDGGAEDLAGVGGDILDGDDSLLMDPLGGTGGQGGLAGMGSMMPTMLTGVLGGMLGAVASIPQSLGQQAQGLASQALQGITGLTTGLNDSGDDLEDIPGTGLGGIGSGGGGAGGGGGETAPAAAGLPKLPAATDSMLAMSAPPPVPPMAGLTGSPTQAAASAAGMGGAPPMMMPMGAGAGAGGAGTRAVKDPDKTIAAPPQPNSAPVKGEALRPHTARADTAPKPPPPTPRAPAKAAPRRIEAPKERDQPS